MKPSASNLPQTQTNLTLSRRFSSYLKDDSKRGKSLALANLLENIKKQEDFKEFSPELVDAISKIRARGRETDDSKREKVLSVLREFPSRIDEISEDTGISIKELKLVLKSLLMLGRIVEKHQPHWQAAGEHYTSFYELTVKGEMRTI